MLRSHVHFARVPLVNRAVISPPEYWHEYSQGSDHLHPSNDSQLWLYSHSCPILFIFPSPPKSLEMTHLFSVSIYISFQDCIIVGIARYVILGIDFFQPGILNLMQLSLVHSFLWLYNIPLSMAVSVVFLKNFVVLGTLG